MEWEFPLQKYSTEPKSVPKEIPKKSLFTGTGVPDYSVSGTIGSLSGTIGGLSGTIGGLPGTIGGVSSTIGGLSRAIGGVSSTIGGLSGTIEHYRPTLGLLSGTLRLLSGTLETTIGSPLSCIVGSILAVVRQVRRSASQSPPVRQVRQQSASGRGGLGNLALEGNPPSFLSMVNSLQ